MKKIKLFLIILSILFICLTVFLVVQTYSKYLSSANGETTISIAKWNILVNNLSVKNNTDISSTIVPVFPGNDNISSNVIAPTAEGYFDLYLDFSETDVSFNYNISSTVSDESPVKDFIIVGYSIDSAPRIDFNNSQEKVITEDILLSSNIKNRTIRIFVKWIDDESQTMSNEEDTLATNSPYPAMFTTKISFNQIID